jgi:acetyl-CoA/propionyl-CoA carboxylase biotin carboxyl carrier protein
VIRKVLIANRGEIAVRVIRACRELGISPVAVYGEGEHDAVHVRLADDAYRIPAGPTLPYLDVAAIVDLARTAGAEAIHPGYGFLAENATFAEACKDADLIFVGPPAAAIKAMGDKVAARRIATAAGVPVVPGSDGPISSAAAARAWADAHGYPVAIKAAAGGGGRGFRVARSAAELDDAFAGSSGEARRYFADPTVYLERYLEHPRHVEAQVFADSYGSGVFLGERDCSVQRRHQKLIEETPSPAVRPDLREKLGAASKALMRAVGYIGAGTIEYMVTPDGRFYFLEMNTRIQVEHTVTEMVTGIDLVKEQLLVASGCRLSFAESDITPVGHAIECRINAEDAGRDFAPTPGTVTRLRLPGGPGVRVDTAFEPGAAVLPHYDSLIAKLVVWGRDRTEVLARTKRALGEFIVEGVPTVIPFHQRVLEHPVFAAGEATTTFLAEYPEVLPPPVQKVVTGSTETAAPAREVTVEVNGRRLVVRAYGLSVNQPTGMPTTSHRAPRLRNERTGGRQQAHASDGAELTSPLQGTVVRVAVAPGATVGRGDLICVVEAMKMENEIVAHRDGTVASLAVSTGDAVKIGALLAVIE